jgi:hypothetical protein
MTTDYTKNFGLALPDFRSGPWHDLVNQDFIKIDSMLFSALSGANVAVWTHSTNYAVGVTVVDDTDATIWMVSVAHTSAATGTFAQERAAHPTYWVRLLTGFAPRGEWQQNTQYFPYDLTYDSGRGIMALCTIKHVSTATGSILDDKSLWAFLLDMSDVGVIIATAVTYSNTASGLPATDVQHALDVVESQIKALDAVNVAQGTSITAVQDKNVAQDTRLTNLEGKSSFGALTAPHYTASDNVPTQFGGNATIGHYQDMSNAAIRANGNGAVYMQSAGGGLTYGVFTPTGLTVYNDLSVSRNATITGSLTINGGFIAGSLQSVGGGIYCYGWGNNPNIGVIFFNSAQNHYLYHDGTNVTFQNISAIYAGNGRLWGSNDFGSVLADARLAHAGDVFRSFAVPNMQEPFLGAVMTGIGRDLDFNVGEYNDKYRYRWMQKWVPGTGWVTVGTA